MRSSTHMSLGLLATFALASAVQADECTIRQFGSNRFLQPTLSLDDLQDLVSSHEQDVRIALQQSGWAGDPDDFLEAVATGHVKERLYPVGQEFQWMAFRRSGRPVVFHQKCYGGDAPFSGWEITVESRGTRSTFAMPKVCGNIAMLQSERIAQVQVEEQEAPEEIVEVAEAAVVKRSAPRSAICDLKVDEHHLKDDEKLRVAISVSDPGMVEQVHLAIQREKDDDDEKGDSWKTIEEVTLRDAPFHWEGSLDDDGDYKLVAYSIGEDFHSSVCEDRVEVD